MRVIFSRFQGALLGGFVARDLKDRGSNLKVSTLRIQSSNESILENLLRVIQFCVDSQSFQELDWNQLRFKEILPQGLEGDLRSFPRVIDRAIALTPLALLLQDNPALLDQQIEKIARIWWPQTSAPNHLESLQIVLKAIALICQGTDRGYCRPSRFMPTVLDYLAADSILGIQCGQVQALIEQRAGLETAIETLSQPLLGCKDPAIESVYQDSLGIALALFYFLDTPEDFSLTVLRSLRAGTLAPASCILSSIFQGRTMAWRIFRWDGAQDQDNLVESN
ncbi:MAG: hypothetical protein HC825_09855 [Oscillatoriales cyanobacterium RM1_1_9]|nr:hypothetical protein [Oscillatoriales cyanobacterium RM1_1_9]